MIDFHFLLISLIDIHTCFPFPSGVVFMENRSEAIKIKRPKCRQRRRSGR